MANALNKVKTSGVEDDAVTADKLANAINTDIAAKAVLTGSTNNTLTTVTGANAIQGEANLTFDGNNLVQSIDAGGEGIKISAAGDHYPVFTFDADRSGAGGNCGQFDFKWDGTGVARIAALTGADTTNKDDGHIVFATAPSGTLAERLRIDSSGRVWIGADSTYGPNTGADDLVVGSRTSGTDYGITILNHSGSDARLNFADSNHDSAGGIRYDHSDDSMQFNTATSERLRILSGGGLTFNGDTAAANALDDYEEGTWTPDPTLGFTSKTGSYTKVGRIVFVSCNISGGSAGSAASEFKINGLPFAVNQSGLFAVETYRVNYHADGATGFAGVFSGTACRFIRTVASSSGSGSNWIMEDDVGTGAQIVLGACYGTDA